MAAPDTVYRYYTNLQTKDSNGNVLNIRAAKPLLSYTDLATFKDKFKLSGVLGINNPDVPSANDAYDAGDSDRNGIIGYVKANNSDGMAAFHDIREGTFGSDSNSKDYTTRTWSRRASLKVLNGVECIILNDAGLNRRPTVEIPLSASTRNTDEVLQLSVTTNGGYVKGIISSSPYNITKGYKVTIIERRNSGGTKTFTSYSQIVNHNIGQNLSYPLGSGGTLSFTFPTSSDGLLIESWPYGAGTEGSVDYGVRLAAFNEEGSWETPGSYVGSSSINLFYAASPGTDEIGFASIADWEGTAGPPSAETVSDIVTEALASSAYSQLIGDNPGHIWFNKQFDGTVPPYDPRYAVGRTIWSSETAAQFNGGGVFVRKTERNLNTTTAQNVPFYCVYCNTSTGQSNIFAIVLYAVTSTGTFENGGNPMTMIYYILPNTIDITYNAVNQTLSFPTTIFIDAWGDNSSSPSYTVDCYIESNKGNSMSVNLLGLNVVGSFHVTTTQTQTSILFSNDPVDISSILSEDDTSVTIRIVLGNDNGYGYSLQGEIPVYTVNL